MSSNQSDLGWVPAQRLSRELLPMQQSPYSEIGLAALSFACPLSIIAGQ